MALLAVPLAACSPTRLLDAVVSNGTYRGQHDIAYGTHPRQKLDTYLPLDGHAKTPLVVFFYGGSWTRGNRADYRFVGEALASRGIAVVVADYRLSPEVRYPEFVRDSALAMRWAFDNASDLNADMSRIFVMGHSAGAYNAAMLALDPRWLAEVKLAPKQLAGWIGLAGPYDFLPIDNPEAQVAFNWPNTSPDTQPINHVSAASPRALLLAPVNDSLVNPIRSTVGMAQKLRAAGVPVRMQQLDRVNHVTLAGAIAGPLSWLAPVRDEIVAFIEQSPL